MSREASFIQIISGRRNDVVAICLRSILFAISWPYCLSLRLRNAYYDKLALPHWLDAPVFSIGNVTTGGTGKTPLVIWFCERLLERGCKPAVLARGYKSSKHQSDAQGVADEILLVSKRVPKAVGVASPNRVMAGQYAIQEHQAAAIVLDDGFQHRRVGRDLDIVLIDATQPFGFRHMLPRGLLREPLRGLARAEVIVITRADLIAPDSVTEIERCIREHNTIAPILHAMHRPTGFYDLGGRLISTPAGRIGAIAGIARPDAFAATLRQLGVMPTASQWFDDHHAYTPEDVRGVSEWVRSEKLDAIVTTEKDAVKLAGLNATWPVSICVLRIEIAFRPGDDKILTDLIDTVLKDHESHEPTAE